MEKVLIRPVNNKKIRKPEDNQHLKQDGELVLLTTYWKRRIFAKEVELVKEENSSQGEK